MMNNVSTGNSAFNPQNLSFRITPQDAVALCNEVLPIFKKEKTVLDLIGPINICGDIHGQLNDLVRCLQFKGTPPFARWLFLGDFVDRGPCSVEVITLLFALKIRYPNHVYLIRGNHESPEMTEVSGFYTECCQKFNLFLQDNRYDNQGYQVWLSFCEVFEYIPVAAIVANDYLCIHGGISPKLERVQQIRDIKRPLKIPESGFITDLFWSDPSKETTEYGKSQRGSTFVFGLAPVKRFLKENKLKCIIRGHQFVPEGSDFPFNPDKSVITMFTASNYVEGIQSNAAFLTMDKNGKYEIQKLPQTPFYTASPMSQLSLALSSQSNDNLAGSYSILIANNKEQNLQNSSSSANLNPQPQNKVRQMSKSIRAQHRHSLPYDNRPLPLQAGKKNAFASANNDIDKEVSPTDEQKDLSPPQNSNSRDDNMNNESFKNNSLTITISNSPNSRMVKGGRATYSNNLNRAASQNASNSPTSAAKNANGKNINNNRTTPTKRVSSTPIKSVPIEPLNIININIPNNTPGNDGIDLSSIIDSESTQNSNTAPSTPNPVNSNSKIQAMPSLPICTMEQNKVARNGFPPPIPQPSSARSPKPYPYRSLAANSRMVSEASPLTRSVEDRKNNQPNPESPTLKTTPKSLSKSSVGMPKKLNAGAHTPPKTKQSSEYNATPRMSFARANKGRPRSSSLKSPY